METDYEKLPEIYSNFNGVGIPDLSAKLIKRTNTKAMYYRWDNVYEVFRVFIDEEKKIFDTVYPKRELYPSNDDFGKTAWCFNDVKVANRCYDELP